MQRLSQSQYANVIASAFGPEIVIITRLEPAQRAHGLLAVGLGNAAISTSGMGDAVAGAMDIAQQVTSAPWRNKLVPCKPINPAKFDRDCARTFLADAGMRLYRRPLEKSEVAAAVSISKVSAERLNDFYGGLKFGLVSLLTGPDFLFRIERVEPDKASPGGMRLDGFAKASRLSFYLTDGPPDAELMATASDGSIHRQEVLAAQTDRLIASPGFERGTRAFFKDLFAFDRFQSLTKDMNQFPAFDSQVAKDAQEETLRLVVDQLVKRDGDYGGIFTRSDTFLSRSLGWIYRVPVATRDAWELQERDPASRRAGILTHISFLALHSHPGRSSPTLRGQFVRHAFLCQEVPPPPSGVDFTTFETDGGEGTPKTTRGRLSAHNTEAACAGCHKLMDPIGFAMEGFDAQGSFRTEEHGEPIDTSGEINGVKFDDAVGLGKALANSDEARQCIATQSLQYGLARELTSADEAAMNQAVERFRDAGYRYKALVRAIATSNGFYVVSAPKAQPGAKKTLARNEALQPRKDQP